MVACSLLQKTPEFVGIYQRPEDVPVGELARLGHDFLHDLQFLVGWQAGQGALEEGLDFFVALVLGDVPENTAVLGEEVLFTNKQSVRQDSCFALTESCLLGINKQKLAIL